MIDLQLQGIASMMGVSRSGLEDLLDGVVTNNVAKRLGMSPATLQKFIDGNAEYEMASLLGTTISATRNLRDHIGKQGAIGVIIGLAIGYWSGN